ncbi:MAG: tetratricopeptide repeat protein [Phycisphaerae bacterium]|nr:tetratricopeptide repeat protein [Phycisphaerae bacterium]
MAGRVNTRFVASLSVGLLLAFGVVAVSAYYLLVNSATDLAKAGDRLAAKGEYAKAIEFYSKAVNKEQTNTVNLNKWRDALRQLAPELQVTYQDYFRQYMLATRQLARVQRENIELQKENLEIQREMLPVNFSRSEHDRFVSECDAMIALHAGEGGKADALRRFRGEAKYELYRFVPDAKNELALEAEADLIAAIAADPSDVDAAQSLQNLYLIMALRAEGRAATEEAQALRDKADAALSSFIEKNPDDPYMMLVSMQRDLGKFQQAIAQDVQRGKVDVNERVRTMQADMMPRLDAAARALATCDPARIKPRTIDSMRYMESLLDPQSRSKRAEAACLRALEQRPGDALMLATYSDIFASRDDYLGANAQLQKLVDLKIPTTSLDGVRLFGMRTNAQFLQALFQAKAWHYVTDEDKPKVLAAAREYRAKLGAVMAPDMPQLMFVDAQLAFAEGDLSRANRLLDQYLKAVGNRPNGEALMLAAQVADRLNQPGLAKQRLEQLLALNPGRPQTLVMLAEIETKLQNLTRAREIYDQLLAVAPDNMELKNRRDLIGVVEGSKPTGGVVDPVVADLVTAQEMLVPPPGKPARPEELIPYLEKAVVRHNYDWRLVQPLGNAYRRANQPEKAVALANKAVELHPDVKQARQYQIAVTRPDSAESQIAIIELDTEAPEIERKLGAYQIYRRYNMPKEAAEALAQAAAINADDQRVVEFQFLDAIDAKNLPAAKALAERAAKANMDEADGLTFRARVLAAEGNFKDAVSAMEQAVAKGGALPEAWRLKGRMEMLVGRSAEAVESFRRAVALRPNDVASINDVLSALIGMGRQEEALTFARASEKFGRDDPAFIASWLGLEAAVGNKSVARERRETMSKNSPNDRTNLVALAAIYIGERDWAKARPMIDRARALGEGYDILALDAAWNWEQGERQKARDIFEKHIAGIEPAKMSITPHIAYAQFLVQRQDFEGALAELEKARAYQSSQNAEADKVIADVLMRVMSYDKATEVCRRIVNAGADTQDHLYRKRLAECLMKLDNFADAKKEIDEIVKKGDPDAVTLLLLADCSGGLKDTRAQREILDRAVARFPGEAMVFLKRGQTMMSDPKTARDAISDFGRALSIRPDMWQAMRMRAFAYITLGQLDEAVKDLGGAVKIAPYNDELLYGLVADLLRMGRTGDALDIASRAIASRPRDLEAMNTLGRLFARADAHQQASRFFRDAFEIDGNDRNTQFYLDTLLAINPPDLLEAKRVLNKVGSQRISANPGLLMALSKVFMKEAKVPQAEAAARDALKLLQVDQPAIMLAWFNDLRKLINDKNQTLRYLEDTGRVAQAAAAQEWIEYFRTALNLEDASTRNATIAPARDFLGRVKDPSIRQLTFRGLGSALVEAGEHGDAAKLYRDGLGQFPDDVEMNNNLAYILAVYLDQPAEALPMAQKAVELQPAVADLQDTLGAVLYRTKDCAGAVAAFRRAVLLSSSPEQAVRYNAHLAEALLCAGQREEARLALVEARKTIEANPSAVSDKAKSELESIRKTIEGS